MKNRLKNLTVGKSKDENDDGKNNGRDAVNPYMRSVGQIWSQNFDRDFFIRRSSI